MVFEVLNKAAAAVGVELGENIVEEDDGVFAKSLSNEGCFNEFKGEDDRASFTTRGGGVGDLVIETKDVVVAVNTETSVAKINIALGGLF